MSESDPMILDFSLGLVNKTGAYHLGHDIATELRAHFSSVRYWRVHSDQAPRGLMRKVLAKGMFSEMSARTRARQFPRLTRDPVTYLDPLYVLTGGLDRDDIVLCHDVGPLTHPDLYHSTESYRAAFALIAAKRPGIVFVSEASRRAFVDLHGADFRFLKVIPLYVRPGAAQGPMQPPASAPAKFLLSVGAVGKRKNQKALIDAYARSNLKAGGVTLVIVGSREYGVEDVEAAAAQTPGVLMLSYVAEPELRWLYRNALAFCLPSLLEGFGMPALEAVEHGLVSVLSRGGALEEAVNSHAILVNPHSPSDIADALVRVTHLSEGEKSALVAAGRTHARTLSRERFLAAWAQLLTEQAHAPPLHASAAAHAR